MPSPRLLFAALLVLPALLAAQPPMGAGPDRADADAGYRIEVLVFARDWPDDAGERLALAGSGDRMDSLAAAIDLGQPRPGLHRLDEQALTLDEIALRLQGARLPTLLHTGWFQSRTASRAASPVALADPEQRLLGSLTAEIDVYLRVELALSYRPQGPAAADDEPATPPGVGAAPDGNPAWAEPGGPVYRLQERRRLKLDELHYFDHPAFGALVQVSRIEG